MVERNDIVAALRALAEPTRLRLLALCREAELTVSDLVQITGQSQPRISRHLKLLCDGGLLHRHSEGSRAYFRVADQDPDGGQALGELGNMIAQMVPADDPLLRHDLERLEQIKADRAQAAAAYFRANADRWNRIRALHVDEERVEQALREAVSPVAGENILDVGTGTGRMLELLGPDIRSGLGIDQSREMLAIARSRLEAAQLGHCAVRQGDMYQLPLADAVFDAVVIHQVLHFADAPELVLYEAARVLRQGGRLVVADFAPHRLENLRVDHAHRRLGLSNSDMRRWLTRAGLKRAATKDLPGDPLTVRIWTGRKPGSAGAYGHKETLPVLEKSYD